MVISEKCCRIYFRKRGQWSQKLKERKRCLWRNPCPWETDSQEHYVLTGFSWAESSALGQTGGPPPAGGVAACQNCAFGQRPPQLQAAAPVKDAEKRGAAGRKRLMVTGRPVRSPDRTRKALSMRLPFSEDVVWYFWIIVKKRLLSRLKTSFFVFKKQRETSFFSENGTDERLGLHQPQKYARSSFLCNRVSGCIPFFGIQ